MALCDILFEPGIFIEESLMSLVFINFTFYVIPLKFYFSTLLLKRAMPATPLPLPNFLFFVQELRSKALNACQKTGN